MVKEYQSNQYEHLSITLGSWHVHRRAFHDKTKDFAVHISWGTFFTRIRFSKNPNTPFPKIP